jgi:hypothetical protein
MSAPLSEQQLAEVKPVGYHCDHSDEPYGARTHHSWEWNENGGGFVYGPHPDTISSHTGPDQAYLKPEDRGIRCPRAVPVYAVGVPALLAEVERLAARVAELEAERHTTNEALSEAAEELRDANTAAGLVAEYHVPTTDGRWLAVRREPNGDRWAIYTANSIVGGRQTWTGDLWISIPLATDSELWAYDSADAALAEATRQAENTPAVAS